MPTEVQTIQAGLDSLRDRDSLVIAPGTYNELLNAPPIQFWMIGEIDSMNARPFVFATYLPGADTLPILHIPNLSAPNIENVKFQNGPQGGAPLWFRRGIQSWADSVTMRNCIVDSTAWSFEAEPDSFGSLDRDKAVFDSCQFLNCIYFGVSAHTLIARDCYFSSLDTSTIWIVGGADSSAIVRCRFQNVPRGVTLFLQNSGSTVDNCEFENIGRFRESVISTQNFKGRITDSVFRNCRYGYALIEVSRDSLGDNFIEDNLFEECHGSVTPQSNGVILFDGDGSFDVQGTTYIRGNAFSQCSGSVNSNEIFVFKGMAVISGNHFLADSVNGLPVAAVDASGWWTPWDSVLIHDNWFVDCGFAAVGPVRVDARHNWWGDESGPFHSTLNFGGIGDTVVGELQFEPWYADSIFLFADDARQIVRDRFQVLLFPNPFNSEFRIELDGMTGADFEVRLFDLLGREVALLYSGRTLRGTLSFQAPKDLAAGVYFLRAKDHLYAETKKVLYLK